MGYKLYRSCTGETLVSWRGVKPSILPLFKTILCTKLPLSGKFRSAHLLTPKANVIYEENLEWPTQDKLQVEVSIMTLFQVYFKDLKLIVVLRSLPNLEQTRPLHMSPVDRAGPLTGTNVIFWVHMRIFSPVSEMRKGRRQVLAREIRETKQTRRNTKL